MSPACCRTLVVSVILLGPAAAARAGLPTPAVPVPQRVALADAIIEGRVASLEEEPVRAFPLLKVPGGPRVLFRMARVRVDRTLFGQAGPGEVRVGVGPGPDMPELAAGQEGCFFLHRHPEEPFVALSVGSDFIDARRPEYGRAVALVRRCAGLLEDPDAGLRTRDADDRLLTAALLIFQFRAVRCAYRGPPRTEPIDAALSRRILAVLRDGSFRDEASREPTGRLTLFLRLGLTDVDGWTPPMTMPKVAAAAEKWLDDNAATYRIRRYAPEESPPDEKEVSPDAKGRAGDGTASAILADGIRRYTWVWLTGVLLCLVAGAGYALSRRRGERGA